MIYRGTINYNEDVSVGHLKGRLSNPTSNKVYPVSFIKLVIKIGDGKDRRVL